MYRVCYSVTLRLNNVFTVNDILFAKPQIFSGNVPLFFCRQMFQFPQPPERIQLITIKNYCILRSHNEDFDIIYIITHIVHISVCTIAKVLLSKHPKIEH